MVASQECRPAWRQSAAQKETDVLSPKALLLATAAVAVAVIAVLTVLSTSDSTEASGGGTPRRGDPTQQVPELPDLPAPTQAGEPLLLAESDSRPASEVPSRLVRDPNNGRRSEEPEPIINEIRMVRIVDDLGTPVPDAKIEVWSAEYLADVPPESTRLSNGEGLAEITLARASSAVLVSKDGVGTSGLWTAKSAPKEGQEETIIELRPTGRLSGQVVWIDGTPEAGATLDFKKISGGERGTRPRPLAPLVTDASGRFDVEVDTRLFAHIEVRARDRVAPLRLVVVEPGVVNDVTLKLPAYSITGTLVGDPAEPLRDPKVAAGNRTKPEIDGTVDEDGAFSIELTEPATYSVRAHAVGLVQDRQVDAPVDDQIPAAHVEIRLVPEATVTGTVQWSNGAPLSYALISAWPVRDRRVESEPEFVTFRASASIGVDGAFDLRGLHPELTYSLSVTPISLGGIRKVAVVREVTPGTRDLIVIAEGPLPREVTLTGDVHDSRTGTPVTRFEATAVQWVTHGYMSVTRTSAWHDDPQGRFEIPELVPKGRYVVLIKADGYAPLSYGPIDLGVEPPPISLGLSRWGGLSIRVVELGGHPVPDASVTLWPSFPREERESTQPARADEADASGSVSWSDLAPGSYWVEGAAAGLRGGPLRAEVPNEGTGQVTLILSESREDGGLEVRLLEFDGSPASQMEARLTRLSGVLDAPPKEQPRWTCLTRSDGTFRQAVPPGAYTLVSSRSGLFAFSGRIFVPAGEWVRVEMRLK